MFHTEVVLHYRMTVTQILRFDYVCALPPVLSLCFSLVGAWLCYLSWNVMFMHGVSCMSMSRHGITCMFIHGETCMFMRGVACARITDTCPSSLVRALIHTVSCHSITAVSAQNKETGAALPVGGKTSQDWAA